MADTGWAVRLMANPCGYHPDMVVLSGPRLKRMVQELLTDLALSILDGDERAEAWGGYIAALGAQRAAETEEAGDDGLLLDAVADAWEALEPELCSDLYLTVPDARTAADALFEATGRVGVRQASEGGTR